MASDTTKCDSPQPAEEASAGLFDNWFDPIESALRDRVRGFIEGTNAALKRWHGCGRALYRGIERVMNQMTMGILAYNLTRAAALQRGGCA